MLKRFLAHSCALTFALVSLDTVFAQADDPSTETPDSVVRLGRMESPAIGESSGLAFCSSRTDAIWTLNDSGNSNELYLVSTKGALIARLVIAEAKNRDWEAMCRATLNGQNYLVIGDVGDNRERRKSSFLYIFPEPSIDDGASPPREIRPTKVEFRFPDGAHNCEAIAFDSSSNKLWLIEKRYITDRRKTKPGIFSLTLPTHNTKNALVATRIGDFPVRNVTGMAFSPDGNRLIIRNYLNAHLYTRDRDKSWRETIESEKPVAIVLPLQLQGEAICFTPDSKSVIVTSEIKNQPIWQVNLDLQKRGIAESKNDE